MRKCPVWVDNFFLFVSIFLRYPSWNLLQDKPESFEMLYRGSPLEALQRASEVLSIYWELVTMSNAPVDWRCQHEYSDFFSSTTEQSTDSSTHHSTGGRSLLSRKLCDQLHSGLDPLGSYIITIINILQKVMVENQQRPHTERQSETCTRSALSLPLSAGDCCSCLPSTVSSHKRYKRFYFATY